MKYRVVFHIRKQPENRITEIKIDIDTSREGFGAPYATFTEIVKNGLWVNDQYELPVAKANPAAYWLPPHKIEYIELISE